MNLIKQVKQTAIAIKDSFSRSSGFKMFFGKAAGVLQERKDVLGNSTFTASRPLSLEICENVYMDSWIGKRIVHLPVYRAMKNGITLELENESEEKKVWELYEKLKIKDLIVKAQISADIYGSCILLLKDKTQDPLGKAKDYKDLEITLVEYPFYSITPRPGNLYEAGTVNFTNLGISVDISHCAVFIGVPAVTRLAAAYKYGGMSIYQSIWSAIVNDQVIMTAVANTVYRGSIRHYGLKDLQKLVLAGNSDIVLERMAVLDSTIGIFGSAVMDSEDQLQIVSQSLAGLPEIDRRSAERLSAATGIPATLLLGKSPDGQNSTGESDEISMDDYAEQYQGKILPPAEIVLKAVASVAGANHEKLKAKFKSPAVIHITKKPDHDKKILENADTMLNGLGLPDEVPRRYLYENNIITQKEHDTITLETTEFDAIDEPANTAKNN